MHLPEALVATTLRDWSSATGEALALEEFELAAQLAQVVLRRLPRHLATYQRLIEITWQLKRWDEGEDWGRRLLQADPANAYAWRSLGRAAEQRDQRQQAHALYHRAFEAHPYDPHVRAGMSRTDLDAARTPELNLAALGALYIKGQRWAHAATTYRTLAQAEPRRSDFQALLALTLWQSRAPKDAYRLARHLTHSHPNLLPAWVVLNALGNERDRALARNPLESMDPDGEYMATVYGLPRTDQTVRLGVTAREAQLLEEFVHAAGFAEDSFVDLQPDTGPDDATPDESGPDEPDAGDTVSPDADMDAARADVDEGTSTPDTSADISPHPAPSAPPPTDAPTDAPADAPATPPTPRVHTDN